MAQQLQAGALLDGEEINRDLLFATLAIAWTASSLLVLVVSILGVSVALSIGVATHRANVRLDRLDPENHSGFGWWLMPGRFVAWPFLVAWLVIFFARLIEVVCSKK
jgi:hypothetical protein